MANVSDTDDGESCLEHPPGRPVSKSPGVVFCGVAAPCNLNAAQIRNPLALVLVPQSQKSSSR